MMKRTARFFGLFGVTFLACSLLAAMLHEPIPRVHDEFSYLLMADTFASGHMANPTPPLPEFFDTFHVLMRPAYVSKYFPAQGIVLALGEILTGRPSVGIWFSSALACAATYWMLEAWIGAGWALFGALLMVLQYGIYSYWSQTYWGGMMAVLGGALAFGAARRLWNDFSWKSSVWLAIGIAILANSRPLEGCVALLPLSICCIIRFKREKLWQRTGFWSKFVLPAGIVLAFGTYSTCGYNHAITGSFWTPPYLLHERQYQETPQFGFLPAKPKIVYSSPWVQYYYDVWEMRRYQEERDPKLLITVSAAKIVSWWYFFCGVLLTPSLVLPGLLRKTNARYAQAVILTGLICLWVVSGPRSVLLRGLFDLFVIAQIVLLWYVFKGVWTRLVVATIALLLLEACLIKWFFPHYVAPAACLILFLQVDGLRRIWLWKPDGTPDRVLSRAERRRQLRRSTAARHWLLNPLRGFVYSLPLLCLTSLVLRVEGRINGWQTSIFDTDNFVLPLDDWSVRRADMERWLGQKPEPQLVFVAYSAHHNVNYEWVYNHADLVHSHIIWARNLGPEHNRLLLNHFPDRLAWIVEADRRNPQLIPYSELDSSLPLPADQKPPTTQEKDRLDW